MVRTKIYLGPAIAKNKRYRVDFGIILGDGTKTSKRINFGQEDGETFIDHGDEEKRKNWIARHSVNKKYWEHTKKNLLRPSYWARWLLWEFEDLADAMTFIESVQNVHFE